MEAWHGYLHMPQVLKDLFSDFDIDGSGDLDVWELQGLLTKINGGVPVSEHEAREVLETADKLSDGRIGMYELLGAVGTWYVQVGRQPTPALSLAFAANNRTSDCWHEVVHLGIALSVLPCAIVAIWAGAQGGSTCDHPLSRNLLLEGSLWGLLFLIIIMKTRWVQMLNMCFDHHLAVRYVHHISWCVVSIEILCVSILTVVEALGTVWVMQEEAAGAEELQACNRGANPPTDIVLSMRNGEMTQYSSFIEFCQQWLEFNLAWNFVTLVMYYAYTMYRYCQLREVDRRLQDFESNMARSIESDLEPPPTNDRYS